jgi:hypothetical protein
LKALTSRVGVHERRWPVGTAVEDVLAWYDEQIGGGRTPYGLNAVRIVAESGGTILLDQYVGRHEPWTDAREQVGQKLAPFLADRPISTGTISIGTAVHSVLAGKGKATRL